MSPETRGAQPVTDDPTQGESDAIDEYLVTVRGFKVRRLYGLLALCAMLLVPLIVIYAEGWWNLVGAGSGSVGSGWVLSGIGVVIAAVAAVVIDLVYRKDS